VVLFSSGTILALAVSCVASASPFLPPGNLAIRHDIQLLADAGVIRTPVTTWPLSWPDIAGDVLRFDVDTLRSQILIDALERVKDAGTRSMRSGLSGAQVRLAASESPAALRSFADAPREEGEVELAASWLGTRLAANLTIAAVADASDGRDTRLDGSYLALVLGNWSVSASSLPQWWGPGWEGSLILSSNARPIPRLGIERLRSEAFRWPVLRWLGPWRASVSMGELERGAVAVPGARFFAARADFRPRPWLEVGVSRTAQWCGEGRPCGWSTFGDLLLGRDNRDASLTESREPGNQMAGYDLRVISPWRPVPVAFYAQLIGEDEASGLPSKFLGLLGAESWGGSRWGSHRVYAEYADTSCNFSRRVPQFDCAYRNGLYPEGYSYRDRAIGHALDGDGRLLALGIVVVRPHGASASLRFSRAELNRGGTEPEAAHTLASARDEIRNLELQYNRAFAGGELSVGLGIESFDGPLREGSEPRGFVQWRQGF
jgi:hypothetical protein